MYLPVFKADKGGERVRGSLGRGTGFAPPPAREAGVGNASFSVSIGGRASSGLSLCEKKPPFLNFGGEGPRSRGYKLIFQYYKALLGWVGCVVFFFSCKAPV